MIAQDILEKLSNGELEQLIKFSAEWQLSHEDEERRISFVDSEINKIRAISPYFDKYYQKPIFPVEVIHILAGLKPIDDSLLLDFVWDNALIPFWMSTKKEEANWERALNPSFNILLKFMASPAYQDVLILSSISEDSTIELGSKKTQITKTEIEQHIRRMEANPFLPGHIEDIEDDLITYLELRHELRLKKKRELFHVDTGDDKDSNKNQALKITAPVKALFCYYVSRTIEPIKERSVEDYCRHICERYKLDYTDRVRQNFSTSDTPKNRQKVKDLILPHIDEQSQILIEEFLNTKYNLYA